MLRYVLEPAAAGVDDEAVLRGREELAAGRTRLTGRAELLDGLEWCYLIIFTVEPATWFRRTIADKSDDISSSSTYRCSRLYHITLKHT